METTGRSVTRPPKTVVAERASTACSRTQSTHCTPTAAARWHSGQVGRPQRWQRTYETRSGCRGQTGGACWSWYAVGSLIGTFSTCAPVGSGSTGAVSRGHPETVTRSMTTSSTGLSFAPVGTAAIVSTTSRLGPSATSPKIVCLPCSHVVGADRDEELRAVGALAHPLARVRHREHVRLGEVLVGADLVVEGVARAAHAPAERAAALDHEAGDDAVEDQAVVERRRVACGRRRPGTPARPGPDRRSSGPSSARGRGRG